MLDMRGNTELLDHEFDRVMTKEEYNRAISTTEEVIKGLFPLARKTEQVEKGNMIVITVDGSQTLRGNDYKKFLLANPKRTFVKRNYYGQSYMVGDVLALTLDEYSCNMRGEVKGLVKAEVYLYVNGTFHSKLVNNGNKAFVWAQALANELQQKEEKEFLNSFD